MQLVWWRTNEATRLRQKLYCTAHLDENNRPISNRLTIVTIWPIFSDTDLWFPGLTCPLGQSRSSVECCDLWKILFRQNPATLPSHRVGESPHFSFLAYFMRYFCCATPFWFHSVCVTSWEVYAINQSNCRLSVVRSDGMRSILFQKRHATGESTHANKYWIKTPFKSNFNYLIYNPYLGKDF